MHKQRLRLSVLTVALSYIVLSMVVLALFSVSITYSWREIIEKRDTKRLNENLQRLSWIYASGNGQGFDVIISAITQVQSVGDETLVLLATPELAPVMGNMTAWPTGVPATPGMHEAYVLFNGRKIEGVFTSTVLPDRRKLIIGRNISSFQRVKVLFWSALAGAAAVIVLTGFLGRWLIRSALLSEITRIKQTAEAIIAGDYARRLPINSRENELDLFSEMVNRLLDQLEQLIHANRHVSDSVAHDLRTPLAELRFRLESLTLSDYSIETIYNEIDAVIVDIDRVILVFNALLRLAEIDYGARRSGFRQVDIAKMVDDVVDFYRPLAELKGISLRFQSRSNISTSGDALLLAQAVGNLIDNALKYTQNSVKVQVQVLHDSDRILITVSDDGAGIADEEKPRVIERFYRSDTSRGIDGVGLGLSLVAAVATLHGGSLELTDAHPGLHATLIIQICNNARI